MRGAAIDPTPRVNARYGAPMGRPNGHVDPDATGPFALQRVPIDSGGYDRGGAYWGLGEPLYWFEGTDGAGTFFRVEREDISEAFEALGGVRIGEPGYAEFQRRCPNWARDSVRLAAKHIVRRDYCEGARFHR